MLSFTTTGNSANKAFNWEQLFDMPILPPAPNCVQVDLKGLNQGALWQNKIHFVGEASIAGVTSAQLSTFNDAIAASWTTNIAPLCNPLVSLTDVNSIILTDRTSPTFYSNDSTPPVGTNAGTPLPTSAAVCISWHINRRYRGGHGRVYVPAGNIDDIENGRTLTSTFLTQARSAATSWHTTLQGLSLGGVAMALVVLSYYEPDAVEDPPGHHASVLRPEGVPFTVTSAGVRSRLDTQRRRLGKEVS